MSTPWETFGTVSTTTGFVGNVISGASNLMGGYKAYLSPQNAMQEAWNTLEQIQSLIGGISKTRRLKIEVAYKDGFCKKSVPQIEEEVELLRDRYCILGEDHANLSYRQRLFPPKQFWLRIKDLQDDMNTILGDTMKTTVSIYNESERAALGNPVRKPSSGSADDDPPTGADSEPDSPTTPSGSGSFENIPLTTSRDPSIMV